MGNAQLSGMRDVLSVCMLSGHDMLCRAMCGQITQAVGARSEAVKTVLDELLQLGQQQRIQAYDSLRDHLAALDTLAKRSFRFQAGSRAESVLALLFTVGACAL